MKNHFPTDKMTTTDNSPSTAPLSPTSPIIVIGRQFGSGGRKIGKLVADKIGYPYYDKELLSEVALSLGFSKSIFAENDEKKPSPFRSLLQGIYGIADNFHDTSLCGERLYHEQSKVIRRLCEEKGCVIVGRTADYVLRDHPGLVSVFLHSPIERRAEEIVNRGDASHMQEACEMAKKQDRDRESYYNYYTGKQWGSASNYHLTIDASSVDADTIADIIIAYAKKKLTRRN